MILRTRGGDPKTPIFLRTSCVKGPSLRQLLVAGHLAPVEVVVEVGRGLVVPVAVPAKGEVVRVLQEVDVAEVVVLLRPLRVDLGGQRLYDVLC